MLKNLPNYNAPKWTETIPNSWQIDRLKWSLSSIESGNREKGGANPEGCVFSIGGEHISWTGELLLDNPKFISESFYSQLNSGKVQTGDILLVKDGATIGKCAYIEELPFAKCAVNEHVFILRSNAFFHSKFIYYFILSRYGQDQIYMGIRGAAQGGLIRDFVNEFLISYPKLSKQQAIANFLDHKTTQIDALIVHKQRQIERLQEYRTALINQAVTKGLDPNVPMKDSGIEWLGEIPEHWEIKRTKYIFSLSTEKAPIDNDMELISLYTNIGVRPRKELMPRGNKASTTDGYWVVKKDDIIVNKLLAWMGAIGYCAYDGVTSPAYDVLRKKTLINSKFYHYLFRCEIYLPEFKRRSRGIMEMRLRLYFDEFAQIPLVYPPFKEQNEIVIFLDSLDLKIDEFISNITRQIELLNKYRTSLISAAVTGKIDVRDWKGAENGISTDYS